MPEVFISYSRKDKDFVAQLQGALAAHQQEAWLDTREIPPTAEWLKEIYAAIEGADSFVFIISPEVLNSEVCQLELSHAVKHHKRLIPVVRRDVNPSEVPDMLARLHWIFCREEDDFNNAFQAVLTALATDLDHVRAHTRLLLKALEWEGRGREKSLLLRGGELKRSEEWLVAGRDREPEPTPLQVQYLLASRQAETGRQRKTLTAVVLGLVVAIGLAMAAFYQYRVACQRGRIALSRQLAAQSSALLDKKLDLALLLSLESNSIASTVEAKASLIAALMNKPKVRHFLRGNTHYITGLAFSPDGRMLASSSLAPMTNDRGLIFWDLNRNPLRSISVDDKTYSVHSVAFSPDCKMLAIGGRDEIILWNAVKHKVIDPGLPVFGGLGTFSLTFHPDGKALASGHERLVVLWDVAGRRLLKQFIAADLDVIRCLAFSPDGKTLAAGGWENFRLWDVPSGKTLGASRDSSSKSALLGLRFGPDGKTLVTVGSDKKIRVWNMATLRPLGPPQSPPLLRKHTEEYLGEDVISLSDSSGAVSPDGRIAALPSGDNAIVLWDLASKKLLGAPLTCGNDEFTRLAFGSDGKTLAAGRITGEVLLWDLDNSIGLGDIIINLPNAVTVVLSPDGQTLATSAEKDKRVFLWDVKSGKPLGDPLIGHEDDVYALAFSRDGKILASGGKDNSVILWDVVQRQPLGRHKIYRGDVIVGLTFGVDNKTLVSAGEEDVISWDISFSKEGHKLDLKSGELENGMFPLTVSRDGTKVAFVQGGENIILKDSKTFKNLGPPLEGHKDRITCLAFSPDGKTLASGSRDKAIIMWDVATFRPLGQPIYYHSEAVTSLSFSPDGSILASGSVDKTIILWDVAARQPIGALVGHKGYVLSLAFSPDGKSLASFGWDRSLIRWDVDFESWKKRACRIANRNLTQEEWQRYLGDEPYHLTCANLPAPGKP